MTTIDTAAITVELPEVFDEQGSLLPGVQVGGWHIAFGPAKCFVCFESSTWLIADRKPAVTSVVFGLAREEFGEANQVPGLGAHTLPGGQQAAGPRAINCQDGLLPTNGALSANLRRFDAFETTVRRVLDGLRRTL
ncbi:hypothetical protein [Streptomyces sp. NPDC056938]|uniref:hypothetical protein n=1 Tax=unclassified Streptomyces TaxID=2593676 RepID=UPI003635DEF4